MPNLRMVRLISLDGVVSHITEVERTGVAAIIFSNRVFLYHSTIGMVEHYREISAERVRHIADCAPSAKPLVQNGRIDYDG